ncbi:MAG: hypothetical protein RL748_175 [Pseudomonadota bacterium]
MEVLYLADNLHTSLPPEIVQLLALIEFNINRNQLTALPQEIGQLSALTVLYLGSNKLTTLPPEIGQLPALKGLFLYENQISALPAEIGQLSALTVLNLRGNQLTALPPQIGKLKALIKLSLEENKLSNLPTELTTLPRLRMLHLHQNPELKIPTTVLGSSDWEEGNNHWTAPQTILSYYFSRTNNPARPLNEVKLLIVGRGGTGKTSTIRAIQSLPFCDTEESTAGIALCDWQMTDCKKDTVTAHVWDFAGQVITHSMHQFFFSERSMYVLVLTGRENNELEDAEYWLRLIMAFGKDEHGNGPPVIITLNKWDDKSCRPKFDREALQERYPCIRAFIETDCKSARGIDKLKKALAKQADQLEWVHQPFPATWDDARNKLAPKRKKRPHLPFDEFRALCTANGVEKDIDQIALADVLHNLGIALNYRRDPRLRESTVLQPDWLTRNVYKLLRRAEKKAGVLTEADRDAVLRQEKDIEMRAYLMQIMERFEVAYCTETSESPLPKAKAPHWLLPQALPDSQPKAAATLAAATEATKLRYSYPALPEGFLARAIVRTHEFIEQEGGKRLQWANGVILAMDDARALLRATPQERQITLTVVGPEDARRKLAGLCRSHMREIHSDIPGLGQKEETLFKDQWLDSSVVEADEKHGKPTPLSIPGVGSFQIDPTAVNNAYDTKAARNDEWKPKVFISYSKANVRQRDSLVNQLNILANEGLMDKHWHDRMIIPGENWNDRIQAELNEADLIVLLLSNNALGTKYITQDEIPLALARHDAKQACFVPIILEDCRWVQFKTDTKTQLADLNALPEKGKPIVEWKPNQLKGWKSVSDGLAVVLTEILKTSKKRDTRRR